MFTNSTIGRFFILMGDINTVIRDNTTYKGTAGMSVACSQKNEYISDLFHNLSFIGKPIANDDATEAYYHISKHINWFSDLSYNHLTVYRDINVNIDEIKALFEEMKLEIEPFIDNEKLEDMISEDAI